MKILVDEMPACKDNCWFSDTRWVDDHWEPYCILGPDGVTDCDLENGECSKLHSFQVVQPEPQVVWTNYIPEACRSCSNHPANGGSGNCNCTLGSPSVTCSSIDCQGR